MWRYTLGPQTVAWAILTVWSVLSLSMLLVPTSILLDAPTVNTGRVFPHFVEDSLPFRFSSDSLSASVATDSPGCLVTRAPSGQLVARVCHLHMTCLSGRLIRTPFIEVYETKEKDQYLVTMASACDSSCYDDRAALFSNRGERLDDTYLNRILLRHRWYGGVLMALFVLIRIRPNRRKNPFFTHWSSSLCLIFNLWIQWANL